MGEINSQADYDCTGQVVRALVLYALAEFQTGNATTITVIAEGTSFSISDDGRGHAIDRTVATHPYLPFIYTQLEYPFSAQQGGSVQLHGIGMSLLNTLCTELTVTVRKRTETLFLKYRDGRLQDEVRTNHANEATGNTVSGRVNSIFQFGGLDTKRIEQWLIGVLAANPSLKLNFNGKELYCPSKSAA